MGVAEPVVVRMFVDDVSGVGLWPGAVGWPPRPSFREETLPISAGLRGRIQAWVDEYTESILGPRDGYDARWPLQHAWRGHDLSEELQAALGDGYWVDYHFHTCGWRDGRPPREVSLASLSALELDGLPELPEDLRGRLLAWMDQRPRFEEDEVELYRERYAWEDEGTAIRHELRRVWGPTYSV